MRYSSALMLGSLAIGQAAASNNVRHASFHARRSAESKRNADDVDWANVAYDFSGVDFNTVDYGGGKASSTAVATAPAATAPAASSYAAAPVSSKAQATSSAQQPAEEKPTSTSAAAPAKTSSSSVGDVIGDITEGLDKFVSSLGSQPGINSKTKGDNLWLGEGGDYTATFTNDGDSTAGLICWRTATMWINAVPPQIFITIPAGGKQTISMMEGFSGGCGAAFADSKLVDGLLNESILEFTAKSGPGEGCFDVSREINMKGVALSAKGSVCTSGLSGDELSCTFVCTNGSDKCGKKGEYDIAVGAAEAGGKCMVGEYDGAPSGGCLMSGPGEHVQVTIFGHRTWPAA